MPGKFNNSLTTCQHKSRTHRLRSQRVKLFALLLPLILSACQTTMGSVEISKPAFCSAARAIYWSKHDTPPTIQQIKEHNAVGVALNCGWRKK